MKRTIAFSSSCAILLSPAFSLTAQSTASPSATSTSGPALTDLPSATSNTQRPSPKPVVTADSTLKTAEPSPSEMAPSISEASSQLQPAPVEKAAPIAAAVERGLPVDSEGPPVIPPGGSSAAVASPSPTPHSVPGEPGEIVSTLPPAIQKDLQAQLEPSTTISSHGEQPLSSGPEECVTAPQCGSRQALGFTMLAWGAALAGLIGLIVWIGKPGKNPCCDSTSDCCP